MRSLSGKSRRLLKILDSMVPEETEAEDGGPGSGNWGHKGRPGKVGGSGKGGGKQYRGGRSDIAYTSSRHDWLNGLFGEKQHEAQKWMRQMRMHYGQPGETEKSVEQNVMEDLHHGSAANKQKLLEYMSEARGWDKHAIRLTNENWDDDDRKIAGALASKYGISSLSKPGTLIPDDTSMTDKWEPEDLRTWQDLKSKAMGGPTSGKEPPDELQYEAGTKERPKVSTWTSELDVNTKQHFANSLGAACGRRIAAWEVDNPEIVESAEKDALANAWGNYQKSRALKVYLMGKMAYIPGAIAVNNLDKTFDQAIRDRLEPLEYDDLQQLAAETRRSGDENILEHLDYKNERDRMRGYALLNKAFGGVDMVEETRKRANEEFQKEQERQKQQLEEQKRMLEELKRREEERKRKEEERKRQEAEKAAQRAPLVAAARAVVEEDKLTSLLNEAKTTDNLSDALYMPGMFSDGNPRPYFTGMHFETARQAAQAYADMFSLYPCLVGELGAPSATELSGRIYAHSFTFSTGKVEFNTRHYRDLESLKQSYESDVASGFHPKGTDYRSIAYHEIAHSLDGWLSRKTKQSMNFGATGTVSYDLCRKLMKEFGYRRKYDFMLQTSRYATENYKEWFAETLAEAICSREPRPIARRLKQEVDNLIKTNGLEVS